MKMKILLLLLILFAAPINAHVDYGEDISFHQLLAHKHKLNSKRVYFSAFVIVEDNSNSDNPSDAIIYIYPFKPVKGRFVKSNAVIIENIFKTKESLRKFKEKFHLQKVSVSGTFYKYDNNETSFGILKNIIRLVKKRQT